MRADCSASIFPLVTVDTNKTPAHDRVASAASHHPGFCFPFPSKKGVKSVPPAIIWAELHINHILHTDLSDKSSELAGRVYFDCSIYPTEH